MSRREPQHELLAPLDGEPGPARRLAASRAEAMVEAALAAAAGEAPAPEAAVRKRRPRRAGWLRVAVAAALLIVAGGASAAVYVLVRAPAPPAQPPPPPVVRRSHRAVAPPPKLDVAPAPEPEIEMAPDVLAPTHRSHPRVDEGPANAPPEDLLALANQRRRDKRWREADAVYRRVIREHPDSRAGYVATLASASIELDHLGHPGRALRLYRNALTGHPRGALAEEARWGIAEAQRALADEHGEVEALRDFLAHHSRAPQAERARHRLEALGAEAE